MNWATRLGIWLESRRTVKLEAFNAIIEDLRKEVRKPPVDAKEIALLKVRMDRLELYTGLKREPVAVTLPGEARIS